jgi:hypothetical protein
LIQEILILQELHGVDTSEYGTGLAKTINELFEEVGHSCPMLQNMIRVFMALVDYLYVYIPIFNRLGRERASWM